MARDDGRRKQWTYPKQVMEVCKAPPSLVPEKHKVRLDGEAFLHHSLNVINNTIEGTVGQPDYESPSQRDVHMPEGGNWDAYKIILTLERVPAALCFSRVSLIVRSGTAPYMAYYVHQSSSCNQQRSWLKELAEQKPDVAGRLPDRRPTHPPEPDLNGETCDSSCSYTMLAEA